ncbi:TPA: hypothetical protein RUT95_004595 [Klebsiella oxytoca]|uniref:hypothetical protein n=1 Tax=Klebsiella oxytoca TaxID=571 RepID=UPI001B99414D|nr:hypothetical protein [Klebsiella oxytoca]MCW9667098.1 hypothetical protein [Klebsiella oxytoca]HBC7877397.1 hypothetical protein [Klebsiella oxytoca]HCL7588535.1 hypothetical protein [Klebsiella oxytoca]HDS4909069.1 hypothetical protein [Klebsiella oxytoca]HDZ8393182.1 hypothetical protein [Klebsiella oxytoca]
MNAKEIDGVFHCDCGFSWSRGKNGSHNCADGLREKVQQLAAENVGLRPLIAENWNMRDLLRQLMAGRPGGVYFNKWEKLIAEVLNATPVTDRIVAGIKADGVEEFVSNTVHKIFDESEAVSALAYLSLANSHVKQLREGADK